MIVWEGILPRKGQPSRICLRRRLGSVRGAMLKGARQRLWISRLWRKKRWDGNQERAFVGGGRCSRVCCLSRREWGGCRPGDVSLPRTWWRVLRIEWGFTLLLE